MNRRIRVPEVRVVMEDGEQKGIMDTRDAMALAEQLGLDLVEISARSRPPVCKIMDYGRFKYEERKKKQAAKKHATSMEVKEIKMRPKTDAHDLEFKIKHVRRFLEEGNKVRLVIMFRGREVTHPETGIAQLEKVVDEVAEICQVEQRPNMEGRRMVMLIGPKVGVIKRPSRSSSTASSTESAAKSPE